MVLAVLLTAAALAHPTVVAAAPAAAGASVTYRAPAAGVARVVRPFDPPPQPWLAGHRGVDLATTDGAAVHAPGAGVVTFAGDVAGRGVLTVLHADGRRSSLEPVRAAVAVGARVHTGAVVGVVEGTAHASTADAAGVSALHWGVREGDRYVDPWSLLPGRGPVVLLPV